MIPPIRKKGFFFPLMVSEDSAHGLLLPLFSGEREYHESGGGAKLLISSNPFVYVCVGGDYGSAFHLTAGVSGRHSGRQEA